VTMLPCAPRSARLFTSDRYSVPATIDPVLNVVFAAGHLSVADPGIGKYRIVNLERPFGRPPPRLFAVLVRWWANLPAAKPEQAGDQRARAVRLDGPSRRVVANPPLSEARRIPADCRMTRVINSLPGISAGVAAFPEHGTTSAELLTVADQCLYESKSRGRDVVTVSPYGGALEPEPSDFIRYLICPSCSGIPG